MLILGHWIGRRCSCCWRLVARIDARLLLVLPADWRVGRGCRSWCGGGRIHRVGQGGRRLSVHRQVGARVGRRDGGAGRCWSHLHHRGWRWLHRLRLLHWHLVRVVTSLIAVVVASLYTAVTCNRKILCLLGKFFNLLCFLKLLLEPPPLRLPPDILSLFLYTQQQHRSTATTMAMMTPTEIPRPAPDTGLRDTTSYLV